MDIDTLRLLIRQKLQDGRLPVMEGISLTGGRRPLQLHVLCFGIWDAERRTAE
jgi:hypothetical protein